MKCPYCDQEIDSSLENCPHCGAKVEKDNQVPNELNNPVVSQNIEKPVENIQNNQPLTKGDNKKNNKIIIIIIGVIIMLLFIVAAFIIIPKVFNKLTYNNKYNYEEETYYITEEENIIDNTDHSSSSVETSKITTILPSISTAKKTTISVAPTTKMTTITKTTKITVPSTISIPEVTTKTSIKPTTRPSTTTSIRPTTTTRPSTTTSIRPTTTTRPSTTTSIRPTTTTTKPSITTSLKPTTTPVITTNSIPSTSKTTTSPIIETTGPIPEITSTIPPTTKTTTTTTTTTKTTTSQTVSENRNRVSRTLIVYIVGSDLESEYNQASRDILEMSEIYMDDYTHTYIYTGGSKAWGIDLISAKENVLYEVRNGYLTGLVSFGDRNMGDPTTLSNVINFVDANTESDEYDLIFWNHGGGPIMGYGSDEKTGDMLFIPEITAALANTNFNGKRKFEFIGFDACLMGSVEIADALSPFAKYMIASEETEAGIGWNYHALDNISSLDTLPFMKRIVDFMAEDNIEYSKVIPNNTYTLSIVDLSKIDPLIDSINETFGSFQESINNKYGEVSRARYNTLEFGNSSSDSPYELVDIINLSENFQEVYDISKVSKLTEEAVVYSNSNLKNAHGLSVYFPYDSSYSEKWLNNAYAQMYYMDDYIDFLNKFLEANKMQESPSKVSTLSKKQVNYRNNKLSVDLNKDQLKNIKSMFYIIFQKEEDGNYTPVYRGSDFYQNGTSYIANYNKKIINIVGKDDDGNEVIGNMLMIDFKKTNKGTIYEVPLLVQDWDEDSEEFFDSFIMEGGSAYFFVKDDEVTFQKIVLDEEPSNIFGVTAPNFTRKEEYQLADWRSVQFTNFRYNILDKDGHYTRNWEPQNTKYLFEIAPKEENVKFVMNPLDKNKQYYGVVNYVDLQGNITSSDLIPIK